MTKIRQLYREPKGKAEAALRATIREGEYVLSAVLPAGMSDFPEYVLRTSDAEIARTHWKRVHGILSRMGFEKVGVASKVTG